MSDKKNKSLKPDSTPSKIKLPEKKMKELHGFEDVIDGFMVEQEQKVSDKSKKEFDKGHDNYSIYDFLDLERKRLSQLETFFRLKLPNMKQNNQLDVLLKSQRDKRFLLKDDLIKRIKVENSNFIIQMRQLFDQSFK